MPLTWDDIQSNAMGFSKRWKDAGKEESEAQNFVTDLLRVFGVAEPVKTGEFEFKVPLTGGMDGYTFYLIHFYSGG